MKNPKSVSVRRERPTVIVMCLSVILVLCAIANAQKRSQPRIQTARVDITQMGYEPMTIRLRRGIPARITFVRTTDRTCATEVLFPDFGIDRQLPLNEPVAVTFTPHRSGEFNFTCGMGMQRGTLIVR